MGVCRGHDVNYALRCGHCFHTECIEQWAAANVAVAAPAPAPAESSTIARARYSEALFINNGGVVQDVHGNVWEAYGNSHRAIHEHLARGVWWIHRATGRTIA